MQLRYPFPPEVRNLWLYHYSCQDCGRSGAGLELHHIAGRVSDSALNAICLCKICHGKCGHSFEEQAKYFRLQLEFLARSDWQASDDDEAFFLKTVDKHLHNKREAGTVCE
jgi:hypothetical protein